MLGHEIGLQGTELERAQVSTVRSRLLKVAVNVRVTVRRIWLSLSAVHPLQDVFMLALARLHAFAQGPGGPWPCAAPRAPPG